MNIGPMGTASGLDINAMVDKIVAAERAPKEERINQRRDQANVELSAYGRLKGALDGMKSLMAEFRQDQSLSARTASSDNQDMVSVRASHEAQPGRYTVEVKQLATAHKIASAAVDDKVALGAGKLTLSVGGQSFDVSIDSNESKLLDVVRQINRHPDNQGVLASVIKDSNGARLVLTSDKTGEHNPLKVTVDAAPGSPLQQFAFDGNQPASPMLEMQAAADAKVLIDGLAEVSSETNTLNDAIPGLDMDLKQLSAESDKPQAVIEVGYDRDKAGAQIERFVNAYNQFYDTAMELGKFDPGTQDKGPLVGDSMLRSSVQQLRNAFSTPLEDGPASIQTLSELGITTSMTGHLEIDYDKLDNQLNRNFADVGEFFGSRKGFSRRIEDLLHAYTGATGSISNREKSINEQVMKLGTEERDLDRRMESVYQRTHDQFSAMDHAMGQMQSQLGSMMSMMPQM
ncbi:flagellar filament capping protein FliD [Photobacterium sp. CCB-ST2H9]|uniref:flagellar filament capping protein FliD n=1 Tax=Photobacterium sp. CCB-ST2H9 TaxID=2912855 RepID=UPI0020052A59|nr:flagellar filament capping protein FliD [Photobacterium sp. CCB-ST2H9]UTM58081.1 flagellar filament capping protein FliD [Photobacterium sp. CCB-ST2H9]